MPFDFNETTSVSMMNKQKYIHYIVVVSFLFMLPIFADGQYVSTPIYNALNINTQKKYTIQYLAEAKEIYSGNQYNYYWLTKDKKNVQSFLLLIKSSPYLGLDSNHYEIKIIKNLLEKNQSLIDSVNTDIKITNAIIRFVHDVLIGIEHKEIQYNGIKYNPSCYLIAPIVKDCLLEKRIGSLLNKIESKDPTYQSVKKYLLSYLTIISNNLFIEAPVKSSIVNTYNKPLINRLYQLGYLSTDSTHLTELDIKNSVKKAQEAFGLINDGRLRSTTLVALNKPITYRIKELSETLNAIRWISCIKNNSTILIVNIPSATLLLYELGKLILESKIITGKKSTPTPTLASNINEVILYPYWHIPYKIATTELLPAIKRNAHYLSSNQLEVLTNQGKVTNPQTINWHQLSSAYFPYSLRQLTGCNNSLGIYKFNFYNPFSVYLHDTPGKHLFSMNKRYFSHGCIRVEKPNELAYYILPDNHLAIDTVIAKGCVKNQAPINIPVSKKVSVFVLYHTAWINNKNNVVFYEDIYNKNVFN